MEMTNIDFLRSVEESRVRLRKRKFCDSERSKRRDALLQDFFVQEELLV